MKVEIAFDVEKTRKITWQEPFPATTKCCRCGGEASLAFVAHEYDEPSIQNGGKYICSLYPNKKGLWLHDACCVAVYFCKDCLEPTALYNQA
jgi:hypothetical protein